MNVTDWLDRYRRAWEGAEPDAVVALFTPEAVYRSHVFREPHVGSSGIREYWDGATSSQEDVHVRFGQPIVEGKRAAVEWWATMRDEGEETTLPGCLVLRFAQDGRCEELREYWHLQPGGHEPPPGWGE